MRAQRLPLTHPRTRTTSLRRCASDALPASAPSHGAAATPASRTTPLGSTIIIVGRTARRSTSAVGATRVVWRAGVRERVVKLRGGLRRSETDIFLSRRAADDEPAPVASEVPVADDTIVSGRHHP